MIKKSMLSLFLLSSLLFQGCFDEEKKVEDANAMVASNEFVLTTLKNKQIIVKKTEHGFIVEGNRDKIIMFDVFATWCPPCQAEAPHLGTLQKKYKNIKMGDVRNKLFVIALFDGMFNPRFEDQIKSVCSNNYSAFRSQIDEPDWDKLVLKVSKNKDIINPITEVYRIKEEFEKRKELQKLDKGTKRFESEKY